MITASNAVKNMMTSPVRTIKAKVELYNGSTLVRECSCDDILQEFTVERVGEENKFFGFGIGQKINVKLIDKNRELDITTNYKIKVAYIVADEVVYPYPTFYVTRTNRDEITNGLSITAYDGLMRFGTSEQVKDSPVLRSGNKDVGECAQSCMVLIYGKLLIADEHPEWNTVYGQLNYTGEETIREVLDDIAEITQTVYYLNRQDYLVFKRLGSIASNLSIYKADYFALDSDNNRRLTKITCVNGEADAIHAETTLSGTNQFIRDNGFWSTLDNATIAQKLDAAIDLVGNLTINQFDCDWRGNVLLEPTDSLYLTNKDDSKSISWVLNDTVTYNGGLSEKTSWHYSTEESELDSAPSSLGDVLNDTSIRIDRVNKEIDFVVSQTEEIEVKIEETQESLSQTNVNISSMEVVLDGILTTASEQSKILDSYGNVLSDITNSVQTKVSPEDMEIAIQNAVNDKDEIVTSTGYTFNKDGLTISKSDSSLTTQVTEDGMTVSKENNIVLTVNNEGVQAQDLHATTYLIIGMNSRFEDYTNEEGKPRTGCFWIR